MTKSVIYVQLQIDGLKKAISEALSNKVVDLAILSGLEHRLRSLEQTLEFLLESSDRSE